MKEQYNDGFFNISGSHGFLPSHNYDLDLPTKFKPLIELCDALPILKKENRFGILHYPNLICEKVKDLPNLISQVNEINQLTDNSLRMYYLQMLFRYYSFLTSSYCLEPTYNSYIKNKSYAKARNIIPQNIAEPYYKVSELLDCFPWLEYHYSYGLGNFKILNHKEDFNYELEDIQVKSLFCGDLDEINFIKVHILINLYTPQLIDNLFNVLNQVKEKNAYQTIQSLQNMYHCVQKINEKRKLMWKNSNCDRYGSYRLFLMGQEGNDKIFDDGLLYENVNEPRLKFRGETGAQDDIIPTLDIFTGIIKYYPDNILTKYLENLRNYRPNIIIEFLNDLEKDSVNLKEEIFNVCNLKGLIYYLAIINEIYLFRNGHWQFVQTYIMKNTNYNVATGGTPLNMWLPNQIDSCLKCMDDIFTQFDESKLVDNDLEEKDIQLLSKMKIEQNRKKRLLESQLNELKKQSSNLQNVINLNKELNENPN